jgi:hypothetical protein
VSGESVIRGPDAVVGGGEARVGLSGVMEGTGIVAVFSLVDDAGSSSGIISADAVYFVLAEGRVCAITVDCREGERTGTAAAVFLPFTETSSIGARIVNRCPIFSLYGGERWLAAMMVCFDTWFASAIPPSDWPGRTVTKRVSGAVELAAGLCHSPPRLAVAA